MRLLFLTDEPWPTFRPDIAVLFGKTLPARRISADLVTHRGNASDEWAGGRTFLYSLPRSRALHHIGKLLANTGHLLRCNRNDYDAIQVRGMPVHAFIALLAAKLKGLPLYYWMSFPQSEGQIHRAMSRGMRAGLRYWFPLIQGTFGRWLLYRVVLPRCDHVFVQSARMRDDVAAYGIPEARTTVVPMGVDMSLVDSNDGEPPKDSRLDGKRVIAYLGSLDPERHIQLLLEMLALLRAEEPEILLLMIGETADSRYRSELDDLAKDLQIEESIIWTGWLPTKEAWRYARAAEVGLSPIPRSAIYDCSSPTKVSEYLALRIPVVGNDSPDQARVIGESGGGLCVALSPQGFCDGILTLLRDPATTDAMGKRGRAYVSRFRSYAAIAKNLSSVYKDLLTQKEKHK